MNKNFIVLMFLVVLGGNILALVPNIAPIPLEHGAHRIGKRTDVDMQHWREYGLGQFIHWGVYAIPGGHWNGKTYNGAAEWIRSWKEMPKAAYDSLYMQFNPSAFNANDWAKKAQKMGAKYVIITTKHHDGFCIWPSKYTDYTIKNTPYQKDILKQLVDEYNKNGIDVYLYFSIIDWNHPGYRSVIKSKEDSAAYERFKQFTRNQIVELLTNYPTTKGLWFDGTWDKAWVNQAKFADELDAELRDLHPGLIIGSRFRPDEYGKRGTDSNGNLLGDYEQGWERDLPTKIEDVHGNDWEGVMTIPENQWGYHSEWKGYVKSSFNLIEMLVKSVSLNGNFVLNFGPDGKGNIRPEESKIAKEIGDWMKINGEAIYNTRPLAPFQHDNFCFTQSKDGKTRYFFYLCKEDEPCPDRIELPEEEIGNMTRIGLLGNPKKLTIQFKQGKKFVLIPESFRRQMVATPALVFIVK
jgi:alpha-L-fucosidase